MLLTEMAKYWHGHRPQMGDEMRRRMAQLLRSTITQLRETQSDMDQLSFYQSTIYELNRPLTHQKHT